MQTDDQNIVASVEVSEQARVGSTAYERDPGKRQQIWELPLDKQEEARRFYISEGPFSHTWPIIRIMNIVVDSNIAISLIFLG